MPRFPYAIAAILLLGCTPTPPIAGGAAGGTGAAGTPPAGPSAGAPPAGAPGVVTLTKGGAPIALAGDWVLTTHAFMSIQNKTAPEKGPQSFKVMFDFDPFVTKTSAAQYILPGWKVEEIVTYAISAVIDGQPYSNGGDTRTRPVLVDTTSRVKGTFGFKMFLEDDMRTTVADYELAFDLPYPATP